MDITSWNILVTIQRMVPAMFAVHPNEALAQRKGEKDESDLVGASIYDPVIMCPRIEKSRCLAGIARAAEHIMVPQVGGGGVTELGPLSRMIERIMSLLLE